MVGPWPRSRSGWGGERDFVVDVSEEGRQTTHRVTAPERLGGGLELTDHDLSEVVRQSFEFLLEREPASSILPPFSLDDISRYFPEYERDLDRRLV